MPRCRKARRSCGELAFIAVPGKAGIRCNGECRHCPADWILRAPNAPRRSDASHRGPRPVPGKPSSKSRDLAARIPDNRSPRTRLAAVPDQVRKHPAVNVAGDELRELAAQPRPEAHGLLGLSIDDAW